jgi:hypothetical protein
MQADQIQSTAGVDPATLGAIERVYRAWDEALSSKDVEAAVVLYADDIRLESPLVRHLTGSDEGIIAGREQLREFIRLVFDRTPGNRGHFRNGFFTDGRRLIWEYPRETPNGDQMDFVESMEIETVSSASTASIGAGSASRSSRRTAIADSARLDQQPKCAGQQRAYDPHNRNHGEPLKQQPNR